MTTLRSITRPTETWNPAKDSREGIRYVDVSAVSRETLTIDSVGRISAKEAPSRARKIVHSGDTIFATIRPGLKRVAKVPLDLDGEIASTAFCVLRPDAECLDSDYLFFLASSDAFVASVAAHETGASYPAVRDRDVFDQEVELPSLREQQDIASALMLFRRSMLNEVALLGAAQELKRAAMRELFTRGLRGEAQRETEIGLLPESWTPTSVIQLGVVKGGKRMPKGVPLVREDTGRPYIRVTDFKDHTVRDQGILFVPLEYEDEIRRYRISSRDVYISIAGSIGIVGQVPARLDDANLTENAAKIVVERGDVIPRFVMYALAGEACQDQIERATAKNAQPKLALTRIEQILVPFPSDRNEQQEIVAILDAIDRKIALHQRKRAVLEELFKSMLHKLLTGEIRVADLDLSALLAAPAMETAS